MGKSSGLRKLWVIIIISTTSSGSSGDGGGRSNIVVAPVHHLEIPRIRW